MHELSLVHGLRETLHRLSDEHGGRKVARVEVAIGRLSCCVPTTFSFVFGAIKRDDPLISQAELVIEENDGDDVVLMRVELEVSDDV